MVPRGRGGVINVSSVAGFGQSPGNVSYCATKAWMNSFTEGLDLELRGAGSPVRVQALCPGFTITGFHDAMGMSREGIPAWLWMRAEDVVDASLRGLAARHGRWSCPERSTSWSWPWRNWRRAPCVRRRWWRRASRAEPEAADPLVRGQRPRRTLGSYIPQLQAGGKARAWGVRESRKQVIRRGADRLRAGRIPRLCDSCLGSGNRSPGGRARVP